MNLNDQLVLWIFVWFFMNVIFWFLIELHAIIRADAKSTPAYSSDLHFPSISIFMRHILEVCFPGLIWNETRQDGCCVVQPANACLPMRLHGQKQQKTLENDEKSTFFIMRMRGTQEANEEKRKKSLLVSDWEWLPKAGWHLKAGCSFGILLFSWPFLTMRMHANYAFARRNIQETGLEATSQYFKLI